MILDEVLYESESFDRDDMVDIFTEGFLFALEMQEAGYKADSTEELSEAIAEGADIAISEITSNYLDNKIKIAALSRRANAAEAGRARLVADGMRNGTLGSNKSADFWENRSKEKAAKADKRREQISNMKSYRNEKRIKERIKNKI